jgi:hypothetical protein
MRFLDDYRRCVEVKEQFVQCIRDNRRLGIDETVSDTSISHEKKRFKI